MLLSRWFAEKTTASNRKPHAPRALLQLEALEVRENPALTIQIDYRFDNGFFTNAADPQAALRRGTLETAARELGSRINTPLGALQSNGSNTWTATVFNPSNPSQLVNVPNLVVPANTIIVFASGGAGSGGEAGIGGYGGYSASGSQQWLNTLAARGPGSFTMWGGAVSFDANQNWNYSLNAPTANQLDFYSVSVHELAHVIGFGTAQSWLSQASSGRFEGAITKAVYGSAPQVSISGPGHWEQGLLYNGQVSIMQPGLLVGTRPAFSNLDYATLADIGWNVSGLTPAVATPAPVASPTFSANTTPTATSAITGGGSAKKPEAFTVSTTPGNVTTFTAANGTPSPTGPAFNPFPGYDGPIRTATGDVNGDGVADIIASMGSGVAPLVRVFDGRSGALMQQFYAFEENFTGGVFVATGDFNGDGRSDIVVAADRTGGPRVRILSGANPAITLTDFYGIDDPAFRGGVRVAVGDLNNDGVVDLVVAAGVGGGPRISTYDGRSISMVAPPRRLAADFFAFEMNLTNGSYVAVGDIDGDGYGDLIVGAGEGGGPRVKVLNGRTLTQNGSGAAMNSLLKDYFIGDANSGSGVRLATADVNGDGTDEILAGSGINASARLYIDGLNWSSAFSLAGGANIPNGVFVG